MNIKDLNPKRKLHLNNINYIVENDHDFKAVLKDKRSIDLQYNDLEKVLGKLPKVFSFELRKYIYINWKAISSYSFDLSTVNIDFTNGDRLKKISISEFESSVIPMLVEDSYTNGIL